MPVENGAGYLNRRTQKLVHDAIVALREEPEPGSGCPQCEGVNSYNCSVCNPTKG